MRKKLTLGLTGAAALALALGTSGTASSHGYTSNPPARQALCASGAVQDCGAIQYEPQSVEGPKGFPGAGPADGKICSAGHDEFKQLDDPRGGDWPTTKLPSGGSFDFTWHFTARHATTDFEYFITKDGWDPSKPLTRADLESKPFKTVPYGGKQPPGDITHSVTLPNKSGHQLILAVWNIADTGNAFYSCEDVSF